MSNRHLHVIHLLIRRRQNDNVAFLLYPHEHWLDPDGNAYLSLPTKRSVDDPEAVVLDGRPIEEFVDRVAQDDLGLQAEQYVLEQEIEAAEDTLLSPTLNIMTRYTVYPVDIWVEPAQHDAVASRVGGQWMTCEEALEHPRVSPTARLVLSSLSARHASYVADGSESETDRYRAQALRRVFSPPGDGPSMEGLANKWLHRNRAGVRHLKKVELDQILDTGDRAFNLRVADPYLRYQMQGLGFTWSFFTHKDAQDCHVHGAPVVEIYGILEGRLEVWWKPYYDRGTSAWNHRILEAGDWLEVGSLQCHIVRWLGEGKSVVFKAGPGPLAEVGKLGVKGKTKCDGCPCMKPPSVLALEEARRNH